MLFQIKNLVYWNVIIISSRILYSRQFKLFDVYVRCYLGTTSISRYHIHGNGCNYFYRIYHQGNSQLSYNKKNALKSMHPFRSYEATYKLTVTSRHTKASNKRQNFLVEIDGNMGWWRSTSLILWAMAMNNWFELVISVIVEEAAEVLEQHIITSLTEGCKHLILIGS